MWPVYVAIVLLLVVAVIFIVAFVVTSGGKPEPSAEGLTADTYMDTVTALLENADPENGSQLIDHYECAACHRAGADRIAPSYAGIAARAADRRPPLTAAAYIYESITDPGAYVVEGYSDAMLKNYPERLPDRELGDIIAYLLTPDAK
jgi:cytochrome c551/c552